MSPTPHLLRAPSLARLPWLRHAFTTRHGGVSSAYNHTNDLNLGLTSHDDSAAVHENRRIALHAIAPRQPWPLITARQTHSAIVRPILQLPAPPQEADALLTALSATFLGILTADCVPILLADARLHIVAAVHAGWRGTAARIVEQTVQTLSDQFSSRPEDLHAAIGPSIGPCCYQVGEDLRTHFSPTLFHDNHLDLWQANHRQLLASGLPSIQIETLVQCTACARTPTGDRLFFSHRAEHGRTGRMMSLIAIAPEQTIR